MVWMGKYEEHRSPNGEDASDLHCLTRKETASPLLDNPLLERTSGIIIGKSLAMQSVIQAVCKVAPHPTTVLLQGESGTGKDVVARAIHELSPRAAYQFEPLNCAAIPETLLESELFGVEAGAY